MITSVARDDVDDGGAAAFAATIRAVRARTPSTRGRGAHPRLQGRPGGPRRDLRGASRRAEPQPRDRRPAPARGPAVGRVRPVAGGARRARRTPGSSRSRASSAAWGRPPTRCAARWPTSAASASTSSPSASTCGRRHATSRWPGGGRRRSSPRSARTPSRSGSRTSKPGPLVRSSYHAKRATDAATRVGRAGRARVAEPA